MRHGLTQDEDELLDLYAVFLNENEHPLSDEELALCDELLNKSLAAMPAQEKRELADELRSIIKSA